MLLVQSAALAGDCQKTGTVCADSTPCKNIDGVLACLQGAKVPAGAVTIGAACWQYTDTYQCVAGEVVNDCAAISAVPGCGQVGSTCSSTDFNGACMVYTDTYQCNANAGPPAGATQTGVSFTILSQAEDTSACQSLANNPTCSLARKTCIDGPGTRNINGLDVTEACWAWSSAYNCVSNQGQDFCAPLQTQPGCTLTKSTCKATAWDGSCLAYDEIFDCNEPPASPLPPNVTQIGSSFTVTSDTIDTSPCNAYASNPQCTLSGKTCTQGAGTRNINGEDITKECWAWSYNYTCVSASAQNYCTPIATAAGCTRSSRTCNATAWDGSCLSYADDYQCTSAQPTPLPAQVTQLATQYSIASDTIDAAQCTPLKNNAACTLASHVCTSTGGTRNVNGLDVTKDCWGWTDTYTCKGSTGQNACAPLEKAGTCTLAGKTCAATAWDGSCLSYTEQFHCSSSAGSPPPPEVTLISTHFTIAQNQLDTSRCAQYAANPNCTLLSNPCTQGAGTRNINGLDVTEACWQYTPTYSCSQAVATAPGSNTNCQALQNDPTCTPQGTRCVDTLPDGACGVQDVTYQCMTSPGTSQAVTTCGSGVCMNGVCSGPTTSPDTHFGQVVAAMEAGREMGNYLDPSNLQLFKGQASSCEVKLGGMGNCCAAQGDPGRATNAYAIAGMKYFVNEAIRAYGSPYMYDTLFQFQLVSPETMASLSGGGAAAAQEAAGESGLAATGTVAGEAIAGNSVSAFGIQATISSTGAVELAVCVPCIAAAIAIYMIEQWLQCSQNDQMTAMRKSANLCTFVGSWCSQKTLGSCAAKSEGYCCYNSVLARVIEEQGRAQLGKGYGDPKSPDCSGFTEAELGKLDFSQMDLSAFIQQINPAALETTLATQRVEKAVQQKSTPR